ncbi:MAG: hypothetical protein K2L93_06715 [Muribaculaceae bacterium]|nr:hypothetical protein [Muribaculaceae bacterium]
MNYNAEIIEIKSLLSKYYDGATTTVEERRLKTLFAQVGRDNLPEDLIAEWVLFSGLEAIELQDSEIEVPAELIKSLESYDVVEKSNGLNIEPKRPAIKKFVAFAAAAAVLVGVIFTTVRFSKDKNLPNPSNVGVITLLSHKADTITTEDASCDVENPQQNVTEISVNNSKQELVAAVANKNVRMRAKQGTDGVYRTVTDVDEAIAIAQRCTELLGRGGNQSTRVLEEVDSQVDQVYQQIIKIYKS